MASSTCPSREQLSAYVLGLLPEESFEVVAQHLDECPACEDGVRELEVQPDTIMSLLQHPQPVDTYAAESGCQKALALVEAMGHEPSFILDTSYTSTEPSLGTIRVYRLLEKLGQGGMGAVYKALHAELDKVVAVKVIAPDLLADARAVSRFKREMKAVGKLEHPNIVRAFDAGEENGRHYLVMEYVPGCDAGKLVDRLGPLPVADACEIVRQAALGLQHAHGHGLIHRDVKPSNLMLVGEAVSLHLHVEPASVHSDAVAERAAAKPGRFAYIKILDLGLALLQDQPRSGSSEITAERQMMGTLDYMAPEQAGNSHEVDGRADVYSLGAALYKLLSGAAPLAGGRYVTPMQKMTALALEKPAPLQERRPEVPLALAQLVERLLAKSPSERPGSPAEVAEALAPFCGGCDLDALLGRAMDRPQTPAGNTLPSTMDRSPGSPVERAPRPDAPGGPHALSLPAARTQPSVGDSRKRTRGRFLLAAAVALLLLGPLGYFFGGTVIRFATNQGEVVIQADDHNIEVVIKDQAGTIIDRGSKREYTVRAGAEHEVEVTVKDDKGEVTKFATKKFAVSRGGRETLRVELQLAKKPEPAAPSEPAAPARDSDPDRRAAEWGLSIRAEVTVIAGGKRQTIGPDATEIPTGKFKVVSIWRIDDSKHIKDGDLANVEGLTSLEGLCLPKASISDDGMGYFRKLANLRTLRLPDSQVSNTGIANLAGLTKLEHLGLSGTQIRDAGLVWLRTLTNLRNLDLSDTQIGDEGMIYLKALPNLFYLELNGTQVGDAGLAHFKTLTQLGGLHLNNTRVTDAGLAHLTALTRLYTLQLKGTRVTDGGLKDLRALSLQYLDLSDTQVGDAGMAYLQTQTSLGSLKLSGTNVSDTGLSHLVKTLTNLKLLELDNTQVSDAGLQHLHGLAKLGIVNLTGTKVTADGVAALLKAVPNCHVTFGPKR